VLLADDLLLPLPQLLELLLFPEFCFFVLIFPGAVLVFTSSSNSLSFLVHFEQFLPSAIKRRSPRSIDAKLFDGCFCDLELRLEEDLDQPLEVGADKDCKILSKIIVKHCLILLDQLQDSIYD
jgi:hypothetical protein